MSTKAGTIDLRVATVSVDGYTAVSDFVTDTINFTEFNESWVLYCYLTNTVGTPTVTIESSYDGTSWVNYKDESVDASLPNSFIDGEYLPRFFRVSYTANGSDGTLTFKFDSITV